MHFQPLSPLADFLARQFARADAAADYAAKRAAALARGGFREKAARYAEVAGELRQHFIESSRKDAGPL